MNYQYRILKTLFIFSLCSNFYISYAGDVIFKCIDNLDNVTYLNITSDNMSNCKKTNLANLDNNSTVTSSKPKNKALNNTSINNASFIKDDEQSLRENKKQLILKKELDEEKEQLTLVNNMLTKVNSKDTQQQLQLSEMKSTHERNIISLEKELGKNLIKKIY